MLSSAFKRSLEYSQDLDAGVLCKEDGSGQATPTTSNTDSFTGVTLERAEQDDERPLQMIGRVETVKADAGVAAGDRLMPSGTNNGNVASHANGGETEVGFALVGASTDGDGIPAVIRMPDFG